MKSSVIDCIPAMGVYQISNAGTVRVHAIDHGRQKVLTTINGKNLEWCRLSEEYLEATGELELGFYKGEFFVPLCFLRREEIIRR